MIRYRTFLNGDPPHLLEIWNASLSGRGAVQLQTPSWLEYFLFSKPYFDPAGFIVACEDDRLIGFAHAGFGPSDDENSLNKQVGILCTLVVQPSHRRQGIGSALLERAESYLRQSGAGELLAGPFRPFNPFNFGLYGGCDSVGFLESDADARPFLEHHGYQAEKSCLTFQHSLRQVPGVVDGRFAAHRLRYEIHAGPCRHAGWWVECMVGPVELHEYRLVDKLTRRTAARLIGWPMETYAPRWQEQPIGLLRMEVMPELRRQGLGKFLLSQVMHHLHDQFFTLVEVPVFAESDSGVALMQRLGFQQADVGHCYRKSPGR